MYAITKPKKPVGYFNIFPDVRLSLSERPTYWQLFWFRIFFQWKWISLPITEESDQCCETSSDCYNDT